MNLLRLAPLFDEKIWGGTRMNKVFGYDLPSDHIGECRAVSGMADGACAILNPEFAGETVATLWEKRRDLFGNLPGDRFPLLIKILDARENLSIQVHPNDEYAFIHENGSLGKTECWYVLDCDEDATIIIGHTAQSKEEMARMIEEKRWMELIRQVPIHKGDFFQIEPGCIHAIKAGTLIYETQQASAITYRFYDYDRLQNGKPRDLHIAQSLDVSTIPHRDTVPQQETVISGGLTLKHLVTCAYYSVYRAALKGKATLDLGKPFVNVSILAGSGKMGGEDVKMGDHLIVPAGFGPVDVEGEMEFIYSFV